jgi:rSAM/selenodomain-associated transferase 2
MISVIIPTVNEEQTLPALLARLHEEETGHEIIVVDGGSADATARLARDHGAQVLTSAPGRGIQIRHGVGAASGEILLFLHADSIFPRGGLKRIEETLAAGPGLIGGNFRLLFDGATPFSRWLIGFYAWIRWIGLYYGDSGIFVRRSAYQAIGGIRPVALMEDLDFVRRMERFGKTCCIIDPPLITSSRRFAGRSSVAIVCGWLKLHALYYLGVPPDRLAAIYATQTPPAPPAPTGEKPIRVSDRWERSAEP